MKSCGGKYSGFTLIEMSIVLLILSIMASGILTMMAQQARGAKQAELKTKLDAIEQALKSFRKGYGRLPCPANITLATTSSSFGVERANTGTCTSVTFTAASNTNTIADGLPVRALGLPDEYAFDPWGGRILYVVDKRATGATAFTSTYPVNSASGTTGLGSVIVRDNYGRAIAYSPTATTNRASTTTTRTLTIGTHSLVANDLVSVSRMSAAGYNGIYSLSSVAATTISYTAPTSLTEASTADTGGIVSGPTAAVALLVSFGPNGHGAYQLNGSSRKFSGSTNADEWDNCGCNATAAATFLNKFHMHAVTISFGSTVDSFDDIVRYYTRADFVSASDVQAETAY